MNISITKTTHPGTLPPSDQLGFGTVFTDHMFLMDYSTDRGWHDARVVPAPVGAVVHQEHMVGEHGAEAELIGRGQRAGMRGLGDRNIHKDDLLSI